MDRKPLTAMDMLSQLPNEAGIAFEVFQALEKQDLEELNVHELAILAQFKIQLRRVVETAAADERRLEGGQERHERVVDRSSCRPSVRGGSPRFGLCRCSAFRFRFAQPRALAARIRRRRHPNRISPCGTPARRAIAGQVRKERDARSVLGHASYSALGRRMTYSPAERTPGVMDPHSAARPTQAGWPVQVG